MGSSRRNASSIKLSKLRGQHFLTDRNIVAKIIAAAELSNVDTVLEVGPGLGVMTREILPRAKRLIAVELDPLFVNELRKELGGDDRLEIVEGDILQMPISDLFLSFRRTPESSTSKLDPDFRRDDRDEIGYKLITNLPYNITSAFLKKFLTEPPAPERIVVMLQKEVAEKICAPTTSLIGLMCNLYAECVPVCRVSASAFSPPPKVESAVICLKPYAAEAFFAKWGANIDQAEDIIAFAACFFSDPRKKMCGMMGKSRRDACRAALSGIGESPDSRPAALNIKKWVELWKIMR